MPSRATVAWTTSRDPSRRTTCPVSSTMPVNISVRSPPDAGLDDPVGAHGAHGDALESDAFGKRQPRPAHRTWGGDAAQEDGSAEGHDAVDEAGVEERPGELTAAFHEHAAHVERAQSREQIPHLHASLVRLTAEDGDAAKIGRAHV